MEVLSLRTILHPADLERSLEFYGSALGLAVAREFGSGADRGVVFFAGNGLIEVVGVTPGVDRDPKRAALWLQVRDLKSALAELARRGVPVAREPALEPWGLIEAWIDDPDGTRIHLVEVPEDHPLRVDQRSLSIDQGEP
ncbi:MAG: VOC family protein [Acidimicrobiales bacterium]